MSRAQTLEWLGDFCHAPQVRCPSPNCRRLNEVNPPSWWRGNCSCAKATTPTDLGEGNV